MKKKIISALLLGMLVFGVGYAAPVDRENIQRLKEAFSLQQHSEGEWFAELYNHRLPKTAEPQPEASISYWIERIYPIFIKSIAMKSGITMTVVA